LTDACTICGAAADDRNSALCNNCNERFHLRQREGDEGPECGRVWVNEQFMTLEFACLRCLGELPEPKAEPAPRQRRGPTGRRYRKVR
jgi:hypothetical protein